MTEFEEKLMKNNDSLLAEIDRLNKQSEAYATELRLLREQVAYLTQKRFGCSSEKMLTLRGN